MKNSGFTLIELSIVLVVIGLVVSGIVGGQALVKQAELQAIVSEVQSMKTAVNSFVLQFHSLPGDIGNASEYWKGEAPGCPDQTCNGNEDGIIDGNTGLESFTVWMHMTLAEVYPGDFIGLGFGCCSGFTAGVNIPASKLKGGGYWLAGVWPYHIETASSTKTYMRLALGDWTKGSGGGILTSPQAKSIDSKMDDGIADAGIVHGVAYENGDGEPEKAPCLKGAVGVYSYDLTNLEKKCQMFFVIDED